MNAGRRGKKHNPAVVGCRGSTWCQSIWKRVLKVRSFCAIHACPHSDNLLPVSSNTALHLSVKFVPSPNGPYLVICVCGDGYLCNRCVCVRKSVVCWAEVFKKTCFKAPPSIISFFRFDNVRLNIDALKSLQRSRGGREESVTLATYKKRWS